jgi:hypothetical protein
MTSTSTSEKYEIGANDALAPAKTSCIFQESTGFSGKTSLCDFKILKPMGKLNIMALWIHWYFKVLPLNQGFEVEPLSAVKCPPEDLVRGSQIREKAWTHKSQVHWR